MSMEKFAARVGCSFQTVVRWEGGKAKINYFNLVKLMALAQELDPVSAPVFANEIQSYRAVVAIDGLDETGLKQELALASANRLRDLKTTLDEVQNLLDERQEKRAALRLRKVRNDLHSWIEESGQAAKPNQE